MEQPHERTIGERVARARIARGIDQETLAGLVGRSTSWVSKIERGVLPLDRKSVVLKLADVLEVDANTLEGRSQAPLVPGDRGRPVIVGELRQALMRWATPAIGPVRAVAGIPQTLSALRQRVDTANRLRQDARFSDLAMALPTLLEDLQDAAVGAESASAESTVHVLAAEAMHDARAMTKKLGHLDLAWMSAELAGQAARRTDDPLLAATNAWNHIEVYKAANAPRPARALALATIDQLADSVGSATPGHLSLWGTMHLQAGSSPRIGTTARTPPNISVKRAKPRSASGRTPTTTTRCSGRPTLPSTTSPWLSNSGTPLPPSTVQGRSMPPAWAANDVPGWPSTSLARSSTHVSMTVRWHRCFPPRSSPLTTFARTHLYGRSSAPNYAAPTPNSGHSPSGSVSYDFRQW